MSTKVPSYKGLQPASETSSRSKQANRNKDTKHEILLRQALWNLGLRYRKNVASLPGKPDIVLPKVKMVVFCDGDFWHGRNWRKRVLRLRQGANPEYWIAKIKSNMQRDKRNNLLLENQGWKVVRFWESDIKKDPNLIAQQILEEYNTLLIKKNQ